MQKLLSVHYIYLIPLLAATLVSLRSFWHNWPRPFRQFSLFLFVTLSIECLAISWKLYLHKTAFWNFKPWNVWIYDAFVIIKLLFFMWFYYQILSSAKIKNIIRKSMIPVFLLGVLEYILINAPHDTNTYTLVGGNLIIVFLCLSFFRQLLNDVTVKTLKNNPALLISISTMIYHSATTPFFIYMNLLNNKSPQLFVDFFSINHVFNIIMYSLYLTSFLCKPSFQK